MKKHLHTNAVLNELKGASAFFPSQAPAPETPKSPNNPPTGTSAQATEPAVTPSMVPTSDRDDMLDEISKAIKEQGKEVSYVRLTLAEKNQLADIIYSYKRQGTKTTETEIGRIAINYLIADYRANGKASILARLLASLHA